VSADDQTRTWCRRCWEGREEEIFFGDECFDFVVIADAALLFVLLLLMVLLLSSVSVLVVVVVVVVVVAVLVLFASGYRR